MIVRFFGIFFLLFQSSGIIGNVISSQVLQLNSGEDIAPINESNAAEFCGANYDPRNNDSAISANFEAKEILSIFLPECTCSVVSSV